MMNCIRILKQVFTGTGSLLMKMLKLLYGANLIAMKQMILLKLFYMLNLARIKSNNYKCFKAGQEIVVLITLSLIRVKAAMP